MMKSQPLASLNSFQFSSTKMYIFKTYKNLGYIYNFVFSDTAKFKEPPKGETNVKKTTISKPCLTTCMVPI